MKFVFPTNIFNVNTYIRCDYLKLNYIYILIIEFLLSKQYDKAIKVIDERLKNNEISNYEREYLETIKNLIDARENNNITNEAFNRDARFFVNCTEKYLNKLKAPTCPNCNKCNCKNYCKYKKWKLIDELIYKNS